MRRFRHDKWRIAVFTMISGNLPRELLLAIVGLLTLFIVLWLLHRGGLDPRRIVYLAKCTTGKEARDRRSSPLVAGEWDDGWIAEAVRAYVSGQREFPGQHGMGLLWTFTILKERTIPFALGLLRDPTIRDRLLVPIPGIEPSPRHSALPLVRICEIFEARTPVEAIPLLEPHLDSSLEEVATAVARAIASTGSMAGAPHILRALSSDAESAAAGAVQGLEWAVNSRMEPPLGDAIYHDVQKRFEKPGLAQDARISAGRLLLKLDRARTLAWLASPEIIQRGRVELGAALSLLLRADASPNPELLRAVLNGAMAPTAECHSGVLADAARLLGLHHQPEDRSLLESLANGNYDSEAEVELRDGALEGLFNWMRLSPVRERIQELAFTDADESVGIEERYLRAVLALDMELQNGGFAQYFFNTAGDRWCDALAGLESMGMKQHRLLLEAAIARFGPERPSANRSLRLEQMDAMEDGGCTAFDELDTAYYRCEDTVDAAAARFIVRHVDAFVQEPCQKIES